MTRDTLDDLLAEAETHAESLLDREEFDEGALETLGDLADVADEAEDLLSTVDVRELADALELSDLPEAVELEDIPDAIEDRAPRKAVKLRRLVQLADLSQVISSIDLREFRQEKQEFDEEVADLTADGDGGDGGGAGGDLLAEVEPDDVLDSDLDHEERSEVLATAVESSVDEAVREFRDGLRQAHDRLADLREANEERTPSVDRQPSSSNPTAVSTMPAARADVGGTATKHSTVPSSVRHSDAATHERVYGNRFEEGSDDG